MFLSAKTTRFGTILLLCWLGGVLVATSHARQLTTPRPAPEFTRQDAAAWLNSKPLRLAQLRGRVVLLDFWAFGCWNCYRSFPWLKSLEERYGAQGLSVVGIHTPEFEHEKQRAKLAAKIEEFGLDHPVMMDNDHAYWQAIGNRYWPTFYLLDKQGRIRAYFIGETHRGDRRAKAVEAAIEKLLAEAEDA